MNHKPANLLGRSGRWLLVGLVTLMLCVSSVAGVARADTRYTVQSGDTLSGIAAAYGVTVDSIVVANNLPPGSTIYAGQVLIVPSPGSPAATPASRQPNPDTYVVQSGDTLIGLADRFGVSREALAAANGISPTGFLYIGQVLKIPQPGQVPATPAPPTATATRQPPTSTPVPPTATPQPTSSSGGAAATTTPQPYTSGDKVEPGKPIRYIIQPGDNLTTIATRFGTTVAAIMEQNDLNDPNAISVGQALVIVPGNDQDNKPPPGTPTPAQEPVVPLGKYGPKWIDINVSTQTMIAFEGQTPVLSSRMSSGTYKHPTVLGTYRVYLKYRSQTMRGGEGADRYEIANVPWVMYFYSGYALHGVWWHTNFGTPMSHGCVNLPTNTAKWMWEWAPIGTLVLSHR